VIYRAAMADGFPHPVRAALEQGRIDGVLHLSRRSAETYVECADELFEHALAPVHFCLSARVAEPLEQAGAEHVQVAARPDEASMLALVARHA
jgi:uroporphyrinogen-III synthase